MQAVQRAVPHKLRAGDRIERYELLASVGSGGMGSVWAARLLGPHGFSKLVAIKTVLPQFAADQRVRAMFLDEARLASAVVHRNVAHVIDFIERDGALYLVMEWVEGISLMDLHERLQARGATVPAGIVLRVLADVCAGLHAAHELTDANGEHCGLVHRDVSPQNVLVALEGTSKLIDFGVAKARHRVAPESTVGHLRGRVAFMAPEQAQSEPLARAADIWSVGATLLYMLEGHGPFGPKGDPLRSLLSGEAPLPPAQHIHPAIARVLAGCLARRPRDRFPTAEQLGWAIEEAIEAAGLTATARDVAEFVRENGGKSVVAHASSLQLLPHGDPTPETVSRVRVRRSPRQQRRTRAQIKRAAIAATCAAAVALLALLVFGRPGHAPSPAAAPALSAPDAITAEPIDEIDTMNPNDQSRPAAPPTQRSRRPARHTSDPLGAPRGGE